MPEKSASLVSHGLSLIKSQYDSEVSNVIIDVGLLTRNLKDKVFYSKEKLLLVLQYDEDWRKVYKVFRTQAGKNGEPNRNNMKTLFEADVTASSITANVFLRGAWQAELEKLSKQELNDGEKISGEKPKRKYTRRKTTGDKGPTS